MGSVCVPAARPSLSPSEDRQGVLQLVSFTLKRSHFRALFSISCWFSEAAASNAPFCSSALPQGPAGLHWGVTNGEWVLRTWAGSAGFGLFPLGYQLCPWSGARQAGALCSLLSLSSGHPSPSPGVLFPGAGAEAGQAEPAGQAVLGRAACAPALAEQGVQSLLPPHTAFPVFLLPGK